MRFIPTVFSKTGGSLPRTDAKVRADFIEQHVASGWIQPAAVLRYDDWAVELVELNPKMDRSHFPSSNN